MTQNFQSRSSEKRLKGEFLCDGYPSVHVNQDLHDDSGFQVYVKDPSAPHLITLENFFPNTLNASTLAECLPILDFWLPCQLVYPDENREAIPCLEFSGTENHLPGAIEVWSSNKVCPSIGASRCTRHGPFTCHCLSVAYLAFRAHCLVKLLGNIEDLSIISSPNSLSDLGSATSSHNAHTGVIVTIYFEPDPCLWFQFVNGAISLPQNGKVGPFPFGKMDDEVGLHRSLKKGWWANNLEEINPTFKVCELCETPGILYSITCSCIRTLVCKMCLRKCKNCEREGCAWCISPSSIEAEPVCSTCQNFI